MEQLGHLPRGEPEFPPIKGVLLAKPQRLQLDRITGPKLESLSSLVDGLSCEPNQRGEVLASEASGAVCVPIGQSLRRRLDAYLNAEALTLSSCNLAAQMAASFTRVEVPATSDHDDFIG